MKLDRFDRALLEIVQTNNQISHAKIGEMINLSASSVRRRLAVLEKAGIITQNVALTDPTKQGLSFIVSVSFEREDPKIYEAFRQQMIEDDTVSQCYSVSGELDFLLIAHATTPEAFEKWGEISLMSNPAIRRYSTSLVWKRNKFTTKITPFTE